MKLNDLAIGLRDLSDTLNACGNDYSDILYTAATQLQQRLLTDAEREAIAWFAEAGKPLALLTRSHNREQYRTTLRGLLERAK
jgi:hypothetical protein